eukprot:TRINITY_DN8891_c0_g1_i3.p1 TRINITY_DN8891_c0_g1~~TRINITY_DN8891_c0_g1_i3.p1  ORF type:complete len:207 (+),score=5.98 TRINITY_DN8891_c0_g1_i3:98-718(+)
METPSIPSSRLVAFVLENIVSTFDARTSSEAAESGPGLRVLKATCFQASRVPGISIPAYLDRIARYSHCSPSCFIVAFLYIDRILQMNPDFHLNSFSIHRLILSALVVAIKYLDDEYYTLIDYAKIGGISAREMAFLEAEFLKYLRYSLYISQELFEEYEFQIRLITESRVVRELPKSKEVCGKKPESRCEPHISSQTLPSPCTLR